MVCTAIRLINIIFPFSWLLMAHAHASAIWVPQDEVSEYSDAVKGLLARVLPEYYDKFRLESVSDSKVGEPAYFQVATDGKRITVKGTSGKSNQIPHQFDVVLIALIVVFEVPPLPETQLGSKMCGLYDCASLLYKTQSKFP